MVKRGKVTHRTYGQRTRRRKPMSPGPPKPVSAPKPEPEELIVIVPDEPKKEITPQASKPVTKVETLAPAATTPLNYSIFTARATIMPPVISLYKYNPFGRL